MKFKNYMVSYRYDGAQWSIELPATSQQDAERRLSQLVFGRVDGELIATIPGKIGPIAILATRLRNLIHAVSR